MCVGRVTFINVWKSINIDLRLQTMSLGYLFRNNNSNNNNTYIVGNFMPLHKTDKNLSVWLYNNII